VNAALLERWLPARRLEAVLKTDLFDELTAPGLYPVLSRHARRVVGVDVSPVVVEAAGRRHRALDGVAADVRALPFRDRSFDVVVSNSTLDHLPSRDAVAAALGELRRVLRPRASLIVTLDNPHNPLIALRYALPASTVAHLRGVHFGFGWTCDSRELRELLETTGFAVRRQTAILHLPRVLLVAAGRGVRSAPARQRWLRAARTAERAEALPTRYLTGHFVAAVAERRS